MKKKIEDQLEILKAYVDGKQIVWRPIGYGDEMVDLTPEMLKIDGGFDFKGKEYGVSEGRPHHLDWSDVSESIVAVATDKSGATFIYMILDKDVTFKIMRGEQVWRFTNMAPLPAEILSSFKPGTMPWEKSLVMRPGLAA